MKETPAPNRLRRFAGKLLSTAGAVTAFAVVLIDVWLSDSSWFSDEVPETKPRPKAPAALPRYHFFIDRDGQIFTNTGGILEPLQDLDEPDPGPPNWMG